MATRFEKLESDFREVLSSWINHKSAIPERWKLEEDANPINPMSYNDIQALGRDECSVLVSRARKTMIRLSSLSDILGELSAAIQAESNAARENFKAVSNMYSLTVLPDELLARIFHFVVYGDHGVTNSTRSKAAVALSHVSQYFRSTVLSCAELWTDISGGSKLSLGCLSRSKDALLSVAMAVDFVPGYDLHPDKLAFEQSLVDGIMPHSRRWRTLRIQFIRERTRKILKGDAETYEAFRRLDLSSLESLHLMNNSDLTVGFTSYHEFQHWDTPNLRHLQTVHYFPLSLPGLANVTSLDIALDLGQISLADIHKDLARMKVLDSFRLQLSSFNGRERRSTQELEPLEFSNVRLLRIVVGELKWDSLAMVESFFSSSFFPAAVDLEVVLGGYLPSSSNEDMPSLSLSKEVKCIFQHAGAERFPRVERLHLEANGVNPSGRRKQGYEGYIATGTPLDVLPSLKHLTLSTNACLNAPILDSPSPTISAVQSVLETITIQITHSVASYVALSIKRFLNRQYEGGEWGSFRELVVIYNDTENDGRTVATTEKYVGDAALEWCKSMRKT